MQTHQTLFFRLTAALAFAVGISGCGNGSDDAATAVNEQNAEAVADGEGQQQEIVGADGKKRTVIKPEQAVVLADQLHKKGQAGQATHVLTAALKAKPDLVAAWVKRGQIYAEARLFRRAIADLSKAIEIKGNEAALLNTRGYYNLQQQNYREALADFDAAVTADPTYAIALNNRGLVRVAVSQYDAAVTDFDAAIAQKADYVDALNNRGFAKMQLEQYDAAISDFSEAIQHNPTYVNAWNNRGLARIRSDRNQEAIGDFSKAIEFAPLVAKHYHHRGEAYSAVGDDAAAEADVAQVNWLRRLVAINQQIGRDTSNVSNYLVRSKHLASGGRFKEAVLDTERALQLNPNSVEAMTAKAHVLTLAGDLDAAAEICDAALAKSPLNETYSLRGDIRLQQGNYDGAIADFTAAKRLDSGVAQAYLLRGESAKKSGNIQQASADFEYAKQIDPSVEVQ